MQVCTLYFKPGMQVCSFLDAVEWKSQYLITCVQKFMHLAIYTIDCQVHKFLVPKLCYSVPKTCNTVPNALFNTENVLSSAKQQVYPVHFQLPVQKTCYSFQKRVLQGNIKAKKRAIQYGNVLPSVEKCYLVRNASLKNRRSDIEF